jgi:hypothetical protein
MSHTTPTTINVIGNAASRMRFPPSRHPEPGTAHDGCARLGLRNYTGVTMPRKSAPARNAVPALECPAPRV